MYNYLIHRFPAFQSKDYASFWTSQFISNIGSQMQFVALNWQVYAITGSALALGIIGLIRFIAILFFSFIAGSVADAHNRKKILFITQLSFTVLSSILAITTFNKIITINYIYLVTAFFAAFLAFDTPARQSFLPSLVDKKNLTNALSLNSIAVQLAIIIGPTISGILIAKTNLGLIYSLNAASYIFVLISLIFIKTSGAPIGLATPISFSSIIEGFKFVKSNTMIWSTMLLDFFSTLFSGAAALLPIFAKDILFAGPEQLGLLYAAPSIGAVIAGIIIAHKKTIKNQGRVLIAAVITYAIGTIIFGFSKIFLISFLGLFIIGFGDSVSAIIRNTIRQLETPDNLRGRMTSVNMIFFMGGPQLGDFEAGLVANYFGASKAVISGGIGTIVTAIIMAYKIPALIRYKIKS